MAFGDHKDETSAGGSSIASSNQIDFSSAPTVNVGDLVYALLLEQTAVTVTTVTDNLGNTYTATNAGTDAGTVTARAYYSRVTVGGVLSWVRFAATASSNNFSALAVALEGPISGIDKNPANITSDITSPFSCPATGVLAQANEIVIAWAAGNQTADWLATSPMAMQSTQFAVDCHGAIAAKVVTATTTTTPAFTSTLNPTQAVLGTTTFAKTLPVEIITVTKATVTLAGKTVTVLNIETVPVAKATVTLTGKTVTVRELELVPVTKASVTIAGQAVGVADFIVERITVDAAAVLFTGQTVDLVEIVGGALDLDFINDASIASKVTVVRAGTANMDDYAGNWSAVAANTLRLSDKGLLVEAARTNSLRNNSMQGAVAGTPGTVPTNWSLAALSGITRTIVGIGTENGVDYIDIQYAGTSALLAAGSGFLSFETATQIVAASGQSWTGSVFAYVVAGSIANLSGGMYLSVVEATAAGSPLVKSAVAFTAASGPLSRQRAVVSRTLNNASTARIFLRLETAWAAGVAVDFTLRIGWPQLEAGSSVSSPIRTTTVAVTRAADVVTVNSPPAISAVSGGLFAEYVIPADALVAGTNYVFQIDDGTTSNRVLLFESTGTDQNNAFVTAGGVNQVSNLGHGNVYPYATVTRSAARYAANDVAFSNDGLSPVFDTVVTVPTGMNRFGLGSAGTGTVNTFAYIRHLKYFDDPPTDAELVEMTTPPVELVGVDHGLLELTGQTVTPTDVLPVTNATVAFAGKTVAVLETSTVAVAKASVTITGKTVTIRDDTVIAVDRALVALTGKPITIISAIPVTKATVLFTGKTVNVVTSTFQDIPKYIIRGRGSRHELWTNGFGGTIKGRGSRTFLVMR